MDELMAQFIVEARELVQASIDDLFVLEAEPGNSPRLDSAFRAVHTLKGSTGLFDLGPLNSVLHKAEDNLGRVKSGTAVLDPVQIDAIVSVLEWIDECVDDLESVGAVGVAKLERALQLEAALDTDFDPTVTKPVGDAGPSIAWALSLAVSKGNNASVALRYQPQAESFFSGDDPLALLAQVPGIIHLSVKPRDPWPAPALFDPFRSNLVFEALSEAPLEQVEAIFRLVPDQVQLVPLGAAVTLDETVAEPVEANIDVSRSLRVDPARIDALLDLVGELMTTKNAVTVLGTMAAGLADGADLARAIADAHKDLDRLTGALYGGVLQTRMVPLSQAFRRLPRMVRDLSRRLGKPTELLIEGDAFEADKTIVDELFEPLLHLVRNAMDHGIEAPAERFAADKPATAILSLRVVVDGDHIAVSLSDDGRGIDPTAIRAAAQRKGLVSVERAAQLDEREMLDLLFVPGFSTAAAVSDLSGRGVGLDAVRMAAARVGGSVNLASRIGLGTTTTLRLPVSFALTQLLVVSVGGERYGVPMQAVVETVRIAPAAVTPIRSNRAFILRDRTMPLLSLSDLLGLPNNEPAGDMTALVLAVADQQVGIVIDAIEERMETVTRPLSGVLSGMRGIAGTTVLGDGRVLLVLDLAELVA